VSSAADVVTAGCHHWHCGHLVECVFRMCGPCTAYDYHGRWHRRLLRARLV